MQDIHLSPTEAARRLGDALGLIRAARSRLAAGNALSIDDLTNLTLETTMTAKPTDEEMKAIFEPHIAKHYTAEERAVLAQKKFDPGEVTKVWDGLIAEAKALAVKGNPGSAEAVDLARRWRVLVEQFTGGDPVLARKATAVWTDAMGDPAAAPKLPVTLEVAGFIGLAMAKLRRGELGEE